MSYWAPVKIRNRDPFDRSSFALPAACVASAPPFATWPKGQNIRGRVRLAQPRVLHLVCEIGTVWPASICLDPASGGDENYSNCPFLPTFESVWALIPPIAFEPFDRPRR